MKRTPHLGIISRDGVVVGRVLRMVPQSPARAIAAPDVTKWPTVQAHGTGTVDDEALVAELFRKGRPIL